MTDLNKKQKLLLAFQYCWSWYNINQYVIQFYKGLFLEMPERWYSVDFWICFILVILLIPVYLFKHFIISPFVVFFTEETDWDYLQELKKVNFDYWEHKEYKRKEERNKLLN